MTKTKKTKRLRKLLLLYFSLSITFRSFAHPLIIMSAIPLAFIGVPWGMLLTNRHFCMPAAMGMLPVAMELAVGLERLSPLAVVAIAGLLVSTGLTLAYVPVVYVAVETLKAKLQKN